MTEISDIIFEFRSFLLQCWPNFLEIQRYDMTCTFQENYSEALWELLIQTYLCSKLHFPVRIRSYNQNAGIDLYSRSDRAFFPNDKVTHEVICLPKNGQYIFDFREKTNIVLTKNDYFKFTGFVTFAEDEIFYFEEPPLDYVRCDVNGIERVLKVEDCNFYIRKVSEALL